MHTRDSLDSRILRWSGFAMIAFLAAAFGLPGSTTAREAAASAPNPNAQYAACQTEATEVLR